MIDWDASPLARTLLIPKHVFLTRAEVKPDLAALVAIRAALGAGKPREPFPTRGAIAEPNQDWYSRGNIPVFLAREMPSGRAA